MNIFSHKHGMYLKYKEANIYYEVIGHPKNKHVLLLHGGMLNIESFNSLLKFLQEDYLFIDMDLEVMEINFQWSFVL